MSYCRVRAPFHRPSDALESDTSQSVGDLLVKISSRRRVDPGPPDRVRPRAPRASQARGQSGVRDPLYQLPDPLSMCTLVSSAGSPANGDKQTHFCSGSLCLNNTNLIKTFNNGSLGSGIDEERSEMR
jgi:hypothetical protein